MIDRIQIKRSARNVLLRERHRPNVFFVAGLYIAILIIVGLIRTYLTDYGTILNTMYDKVALGDLPATSEILGLITPRGIIFYFVTWLITVIIGLGFDIYILRISRGNECGFWTIFQGFEYFFKYLIMHIVMGIIEGVCMLLFIVPGIYVSILFSQAIYIMIDNKDKSIIQCLKGSVELVKGHKMEIFMLRLSIVPWFLLGSLAEIYAGNAGVLAYIWIYPYTGLILAKYYDALRTKKEQEHE